MRKHLFTLGVVAVAALLATSAFAANRGVEFTPIGFIEDPGPWPASTIFSMNPEGTVFMANPAAWGNYCVHWTKDGGWGEQVGNAGSVCHLASNGEIAADGYGHPSGGSWPGYWLGAIDSWAFVPDAGGDNCGSTISTHAASDNLAYLGGLGWEGCKGRRWFYERSTNTSVILPCMDEESCRINDITNDGTKSVGWNTSECGRWRGTEEVDGVYDWIDGLGPIQKKVCISSGDPCCGNNDCAEFVDAYCTNDDYATGGTMCDAGFCASGPDAGQACGGYWDCRGTCVNGPNAGGECTGSYYCPDDPACVDNPEYDPMVLEASKGEGYRTTPDGDYTLGYEFGQSPYDWSDPLYDWTLFSSAYRQNPDGSFTKIDVPDGAFQGDSWTPLNMSDDGNVVVGRFGWWIYSYPTIWTSYTGTLDFQYFLVSQGLDELWFWYLSSLNAVSADGHVVAGYGTNLTNPDCPSAWGCTEGFVVDISKVKVCHAPGGDPSKERTLTIALESAGDHMGHGDFLGTCEFKNSGGRSRAADLHPQRPTGTPGTPADYDPMIPTREDALQMQQQWAPAEESETPDRTRGRIERNRSRR